LHAATGVNESRQLHVLMTADAMGGVWTYALALASALQPSGVTFTLAVMGPAPTDAARAHAEALTNARLRAHPYRLEWMPDSDRDVRIAGRWLKRLADRIQPDVVHVNGYAHAALPLGRPVLTVAHSCVRSWWRAVKGGPPPDAWNNYTHRVSDGLAASTLVVAPTHAMAESLRLEYGFAGPIAIVPHGLPAPFRATAAIRTRAPKESCIFAAGRFWDEAKNLDLLDDIASTLPWPILTAGSIAADVAEPIAPIVTPDRRRVAPRHVWHLGQIDRADVQQRMARAAIYAHPARYEPFGLSVLEAAQAGCALVLGDIPNLREIWHDAALFVDPHDRAALREALARLIADAPLRARLASAARARAAAFSDRRMAERYLAIYHALADRTAGTESAAIPEVLAQLHAQSSEVAACAW
jgi:glycogen(starch) synthase